MHYLFWVFVAAPSNAAMSQHPAVLRAVKAEPDMWSRHHSDPAQDPALIANDQVTAQKCPGGAIANVLQHETVIAPG